MSGNRPNLMPPLVRGLGPTAEHLTHKFKQERPSVCFVLGGVSWETLLQGGGSWASFKDNKGLD